MNPTARLRFVERKVQLHPFYKAPDGGPAFQTYRVLQQWFAYDIQYPMTRGEWRDVPVETEENL